MSALGRLNVDIVRFENAIRFQAADKLYPRKDSTADGDHTNTSDGDDVEESIEDQIARELELIQSKDGKENTMRFQSVKTDTECREYCGIANTIYPVY